MTRDQLKALVVALEGDTSTSPWLRLALRGLLEAQDIEVFCKTFREETRLLMVMAELRLGHVMAQRFNANPPPEEVTQD